MPFKEIKHRRKVEGVGSRKGKRVIFEHKAREAEP